MIRGVAGAATAIALALVTAPAALAASPTTLLLPQATAFSIVGYSCGGIQEKAYATGFDPASGYPTGVVTMSTSCGGSGRGGGYHSTVHSASAGVTWDFTGAVVSDVVPAPAITVNPTFSAYDPHGNEIYNQSGGAYLALAPGFVPVARVTTIGTSTGPAAGGTNVTITGTGFGAATAVRFGTVAAASFSVTGPTAITAISPAGAAGTVDVTVVDPGGASATSVADRFTFAAVPVVSGLSPSSGSPVGGTAVTIAGAHLSAATKVTFGGTATWFVVNSDNSITAYSPVAESPEAVDVRVTTVGGTSARSAADRFTYVVRRPVVTAISPSDGPQAGGTAVTISGQNLDGATAVAFGGVPAVFYANGDGTLTAFSPGGSAGAVAVTVSSYGDTSAASGADQFSYLEVPAVTNVGPASGPLAGGTPVTIAGTDLAGASEVDFGGVPATFSVNPDGSITAASPAGAAGPVDIAVITDGGTSAATTADQFTYVDPQPVVTGVSPGDGPAAGGTLVIVTGTDLANASDVEFGGVSAIFGVNPDGSLVALVPAGGPCTVDVSVTTDGGTSATTAADQFTYLPAPVVTAVSPASGPVAGGTAVTIAGTDLAGASEVDFGGVPASFAANADGSITAISPAGTAGTVDITVITDGGTSAANVADQFDYS